MDIRLDVNPSARAAYRKNLAEAVKAEPGKSGASTPRSHDVVDISRKSTQAAAAKNGEAASESAPTRKHGFLVKEGKIDNSETTFTSIFATIVPVSKAMEARGEAGIGKPMEPVWAAANQVVRDQISQSVQELLAQNGITIPEGQSFEMYAGYSDGFYIHVFGLDDPELTEAVEKAVNVGNNGYYLSMHHSWSGMITSWMGLTGQPSQDTLSQEKESLYYMVQDLSGYDIRTLRRENGCIYTPDGRDLWTVLQEKAAQFKVPDSPEGEIGVNIGQFRSLYNRIAQLGWDFIPDPAGRFRYQDGYLYDIGTPYGYGPGQREWQDWVRENADEIAAKRFAEMEANS